MTDVLALGPFMLPAERLLAIVAVLAFLTLYSVLTRRSGFAHPNAASLAILSGLVGARIAYVLAHYRSFSDDPRSILAIWQGGFLPWIGILTAAAVLAILLRRSPSFGPALISLGVSAALWAVTANLLVFSRPMPLPRGIVAYTLSGGVVRLDGFRGKAFVINLWASWCGPCQREMPMMIKAAQARPDIPILFLDQGEDASVVQAFLARKGLAPAHVLLDRNQDAGRTLLSSVLPTTAFVGSDGIRTSHAGEISRAAFEAKIDGL